MKASVLISFKKLFFILFPIIFYFVLNCSLYSQVPFSKAKADILKQYKGVTVVDRGGGRVEIDKSYIPNRKFYYAYAHVFNKDKIEGHNVTHHRDVYVTYDITGGKQTFVSITKSMEWLTGDLKPPKLNEIQEIANKDILGFFESYLANQITEFNGVKELLTKKYECSECDNFYWTVVDQGKTVSCRAIINYSCLNGNSLEKREDAFSVTLKRDGINQPWKTGFAGRENTGSKTLEQKELSSEESEYWKCNSLGIKLQKEKAVAEYNKLPKVDIPKFKTAKETAWWLHKFLRKAKPVEAEYVFMSILQPWYFSPCGSYILTESGYKVIENIKNFVGAERGNYGHHYCENPNIKEQSGNDQDYQVAFYPKVGAMFSRIRVANFKGEFKISDITISRFTKAEDIDAVMNAPASACKETQNAFWSVYKLDEVSINASFPNEPKKEKFPDKPDKFALVSNFNNAEWLISGEKVKSGLVGQLKNLTKKPPTAKELSEETKNKFQAAPGSDRVWQCRGARGYESNWKVKKDGAWIDMKYRSIIFKDMFYEIWVLGTADPKEVSQFFDSIAIER